jgi:hypothetical protein
MPTEAIYLFARKTVRFAIYPDGLEGPRILAEVSEDALKKYCCASNSEIEIVASYRANYIKIHMLALEKYKRSPSTFILVDEEDMKHGNQNA